MVRFFWKVKFFFNGLASIINKYHVILFQYNKKIKAPCYCECKHTVKPR